MKIINTSKCTYIITQPSGNKEERHKVSNIKTGDIVLIQKNRFNKSLNTQEIQKLNTLQKARVKKINCDQRTTVQDDITGRVLEIQLDLLIELSNKQEYYISSLDVVKNNGGINEWFKK